MRRLRTLLPFPLLPVIAAPVILFAPILLTGKVIFWGTPALQFIPWREFGWELLSKGQLPLWNPLSGMGAPLIANYQSAFFYPPNWIEGIFWALGGVAWQAWSQTLLVLLHLIWAGTGATLLLRRLGAGILGQTVAGMAFGCSGYLVARAGFISINAAVAWLPWILLGSWMVITHPHSRIALFGLASVLALQLLAGHAQIVWYSYLLAGLWIGFWSWQNACCSSAISRSKSLAWQSHSIKIITEILAGWVRVGTAILMAAGLAAVQLLPTAEYLIQSQRAAAVDFELAMTYSFWPWRIIGIFASNLFGNPAHGNYWGYANFWEDALYIGLLPALLALSVLLRPGHWPNLQEQGDPNHWSERPLESRKTRQSLVRFLGLILLIGFGLALGKNTPLFPWLYQHIPTFNMFQAPARFLIWVEICLVLLAGMGIDRWRRPEKRALYWTRLATAGGFAVTLGAGLAWYFMNASRAQPAIALSAIGATALAGLWGLLVGVLSLLAPEARTPLSELYQSRQQRIWIWSVICMVGLDLVIAGWGLNPAIDLAFYSQRPTSVEAISRQLDNQRLYLPLEDENELKFKRYFRFDTFDPGEDWHAMRAALVPNLNMLDRVASANNFDPLLSGRYVRWMEFLALAKPEIQADWLNLMGVSVVETVDNYSPGGVRFDQPAVVDTGSASKSNPSRVRVVPCAHFVADSEAAWQLMVGQLAEFSHEVVIENGSANPGVICQDSGMVSIEPVMDIATALSVRVENSAPGWLVLADQWYPGWYGSVDGQPVEIHRANFLFRAVQLAAGSHLVEFRYQPVPFLVGSGITLVVLVCLAIAILRERPWRT
jgi:hypothetical protein